MGDSANGNTPSQAKVAAAYARLARGYDWIFGPLLAPARAAAVRAANSLPGTRVLELGVGTGLALPRYAPAKQITGIDSSAPMLAQARERAGRLGLANVHALLEMDAEATGFADGEFDVAVAMFVASVVADPRALLAEMRRVVRPGGMLLFVNHFAHASGPAAWLERVAAKISPRLGWRADFRLQDIFSDADLKSSLIVPLPPLGWFQLVAIRNPMPHPAASGT